jgi:hypothetical protein
MKREVRLGGQLEENIDVVFRRVAVKNGDRTSFGQERWTGTPFKLRVIGDLRQCLLGNRRLCEREGADKARKY